MTCRFQLDVLCIIMICMLRVLGLLRPPGNEQWALILATQWDAGCKLSPNAAMMDQLAMLAARSSYL